MKVIKEILFYILSFTWGIVLTAAGLIAGIALTITGHLPTIYRHRLCWKVGEGWGGASIGCIMIVSKDASRHTLDHEWGHMLQNIIMGPTMLFLVSIPSGLRYNLRNITTQKGRRIFATIILLAGIVAGAILSVISVFVLSGNAIAFWVIFTDALGSFITAYFIIIGIWLLTVEIPKYHERLTPYDSIWFEGLATRWGEAYRSEVK